MAVVGTSDGAVVSDLPNLKIEIENDMGQKMETDDDDGASSVGKDSSSSETEEGELVDDDEKLGSASKKPAKHLNSLTVPSGRSILKYDTKEYVEMQHQTNSFKNPNGAFVTGVDVFSPEEQAKLDKRARRFGIEAPEGKVLTEKLLKKLYKSMGVKTTDDHIRTEALHMRGTEQMTTQEVFSYFKDYGPASLEWINDNSCNVVWLDNVSAARALLGLSVHIAGQTGSNKNQLQRRSSLVDSDVEMESQAPPPTREPQDTEDDSSEESDSVPLSELGINLPPGRWRRGAPHPLSPCPLLRFATTNDHSLPRPGYTKFGSHQFGGYVGLISESRKRRLQNALPPPLLFEDVGDEAIPKPAADETDNANPWGILAKTWSQFDKTRKPRPPSPVIERILPLPSARMTPPPSPPIFLSGRLKLVARRRERPVVGRRTRANDGEGDSSDPEEWRTRSKVPRMRMHADDEEKKVEKRIKQSQENGSMDLRRRIGIERHYSDGEEASEPEPAAAEPESDEEIPDLRVAVAANPSPEPEEDSKVGVRLFQTGNVKSVLRGARGYSENDEDDEEEDDEDDRDVRGGRVKSSVRRHRSRSRERKRHHRKHRKESSFHKSRRRDSDSDEVDDVGKTMRSTIRRKSPENRDSRRMENREHRSHESRERKAAREGREKRSPRHDRRRRNDEHRMSEVPKKTERRRHGESRSSRDLRSKLAQRTKTFDLDNEFRSKSPLRIEIDNDEYYKQGARD